MNARTRSRSSLASAWTRAPSICSTEAAAATRFELAIRDEEMESVRSAAAGGGELLDLSVSDAVVLEARQGFQDRFEASPQPRRVCGLRDLDRLHHGREIARYADRQTLGAGRDKRIGVDGLRARDGRPVAGIGQADRA
jgi:hypothetical protein